VLWQNAFLETRWRFLIGLVLMPLGAMMVALSYPEVARFAQQMPALSASGGLSRELAETAELSRTYAGHVWSQWFRGDGAQMGAIFAAIIGTGGLLSQNSAARLFTLSLPVSRERLLGVRASAGLAQVLLLAVVPALVIAAVSPLVGQRFPLLDAMVYALCLFAGYTVFFSVAFLFSTIFENSWAPVLLATCVGAALSMADRLTGGPSAFSLLGMMHGEAYFNGNGLPWPMLLVSVALSAALIRAGVALIARRDF
jgi:hypothetical protein